MVRFTSSAGFVSAAMRDFARSANVQVGRRTRWSHAMRQAFPELPRFANDLRHRHKDRPGALLGIAPQSRACAFR